MSWQCCEHEEQMSNYYQISPPDIFFYLVLNLEPSTLKLKPTFRSWWGEPISITSFLSMFSHKTFLDIHSFMSEIQKERWDTATLHQVLNVCKPRCHLYKSENWVQVILKVDQEDKRIHVKKDMAQDRTLRDTRMHNTNSRPER